jgi:hypothetical protein
MERSSCCDAIIKATEAVETHDKAIDGLTKLYKPVWGLCILFLFVGWLMVGFWQDVRRADAALGTHENQDNAEFYNLQERVSKTEGKYEVIIEMLKGIEKDQKEILAWQRQHQ